MKDDKSVIYELPLMEQRVKALENDVINISGKLDSVLELLTEVKSDVRSISESYDRHLDDFDEVKKATKKSEKNWEKYKIMFGIISLIIVAASASALLGVDITAFL